MPGYDDGIFGNLPPGYAAMPVSPNIEDRRSGAPPADVPANNAQQQSIYIEPGFDLGAPGTHVYDMDQWQWLQKHFPQNVPLTPLADPDFSLDPSIMAHARALQAKQQPLPSDSWHPYPETETPQGPRSLGHHILQLLGGGGQ
jgi:hypothetical protein